jgi:hypothetical protein
MKLIIPIVFATAILARDVPDNVKSFIDRVKSGKCTGGKILQEGFYSEFPGSKSPYTFAANNLGADTLDSFCVLPRHGDLRHLPTWRWE